MEDRKAKMRRWLEVDVCKIEIRHYGGLVCDDPECQARYKESGRGCLCKINDALRALPLNGLISSIEIEQFVEQDRRSEFTTYKMKK